MRDVPQLSLAVTPPQFLPSREQNAVSVSAEQPQTLALPPPAHVCGEVHVPHELTVRDVPQLSLAVTPPQFLPSREQNAVSVSAEQPQTLALPPPAHVCGEVHVPHELTVRDVPQLSLAVTPPQFLPSREQNAVSVSGLHDELPVVILRIGWLLVASREGILMPRLTRAASATRNEITPSVCP